MAAKAKSTEFSFADAVVEDIQELPHTARSSAPNPLESHVLAAVDQGAKAIPVPNGEKAMEASRLLRRAVVQHNFALKLRYTDSEDKNLSPEQAESSTDTVWVCFSVSSEKKERKYAPRTYNNADIRAWANLREGEKITREIRNAYREAHNLPVR